MSYLHIGIDCAPLTPRPSNYIMDAVAIFDVPPADIPKSFAQTFGAWEWCVPCSLSVEEIEQRFSKLDEYFEELFDSGKIRGAIRGAYENKPE